MTGIPAFVQNGRLDVLGMNDLARVLYRADNVSGEPMNFAKFVFLDGRATAQLTTWEVMAEDIVAILRQEAARDPYNRDLSDLIGELSTKSEVFRTMWAAHHVRLHRTGVKSFDHPAVGTFDLTFQAMQLPGHDGLTLYVYTAEPGSRAADALKLLQSWNATEQQETEQQEQASGSDPKHV